MPFFFQIFLSAAFSLVFSSSLCFSTERTNKHQKEEKAPLPQSVSSAYLIGRLAFSKNDFSYAATCYQYLASFDQAAFYNLQNSELQRNFSLSLLLSGNFKELILNAEKKPDLISLIASISYAMQKSDYKKAVSFSKLMAPNSDFPPLIITIIQAWARFGFGDKQGAFALLETIKQSQSSLLILYNKALMQEKAGLLKQANETYLFFLENLFLESQAENQIIQARLIEAYIRFLAQQNRKQEAIKVLNQIKKDSKKELPPSLEILYKSLEKGKSLQPMIKTAAEGLAESFLILSTNLQIIAPILSEAILTYALTLASHNDVILSELASLKEKAKKPESAIELYKKISTLSPLKQSSEIQIALNLADLNKKYEAKNHLKKLLVDSSKNIDIYLALGAIYYSENDFHTAIDIYKKAIAQLSPVLKKDWHIFYKRGLAYERLNKWPEAEADFLKALELFPDNPHLLNQLGYSWIDKGYNLNRSFYMLQKAIRLSPEDPYIIDSLGWAYFKLGRFHDSVQELERAVSLQPQDPILNDHLGDAYWKTNRFREAIFQWRYARDMKPSAENLKKIEQKLEKGLPSSITEKKTP